MDKPDKTGLKKTHWKMFMLLTSKFKAILKIIEMIWIHLREITTKELWFWNLSN